ncbi:minor capsid protein [Myxococcus sp. CA056]|uniref:minor capsid protein n=1 Tax=Myxococcus sp. CA056 TaxID=2741740 RepID=UPI0035304D8C
MPEADGGVPDRAVALMVTSGAEPLPYLGSGQAICLAPGCQIRIRSEPEDFQRGQALAFAISKLVRLTTAVTGVVIRSEESFPRYLGADEAGRYRWVVNILAKYVEVSC